VLDDRSGRTDGSHMFRVETAADPRGYAMAIIDQHRTWKKVEERLAVETDPILRRNLETLLQHMKAEAALDMD
jgi:hypothetical protein